MKVQEYVTSEDCDILPNGAVHWDQIITMPAGTFVKPIDFKYLPDHVKKNEDYQNFDPKVHTFVYCHYGIVVIPLMSIRKA